MGNDKAYIISVVGAEKTGKTDWTMSAPGPILWMEMDIGGFDRAVWRHKDKRIVHLNPGADYNPKIDGEWSDDLIIHRDYMPPMQADTATMSALKAMVKNNVTNPSNIARVRPTGDGLLAGYADLWYDRYITEFIVGLEIPEIKTIVVDSATLLWTLCHTALLEEKQAKNPTRESLIEIEYAEANKRMESLIALAREYKKNLVYIHHVTDKYAIMNIEGRSQSVPVGTKHAGWKHITKFVDIELWFTVPELSRDKKKGGAKTKPAQTITLSGLTLEAQGVTITDGTWDKIFTHIMALRGEFPTAEVVAE